MNSPVLTAAYVTAVELNDRDAQARQVRAMARAFAENLGAAFVLVCVKGGAGDGPGASRVEIDAPRKPRIVRQLVVALAAAALLSRRSPALVMTRELVPALVLWAWGFNVVLELHTAPGMASTAVLAAVSPRAGFSILTISGFLASHLRDRLPHAREILSHHDGAFLGDFPPLPANERRQTRAMLGGSDLRLLAAYTGSLYKGRDAESLRTLAEACPQVDFAIVGGAGPLLDAARDFYQSLPNVTCLGHQDGERVRSIQRSADLLLYPLTRSNRLWRYTSPLKLFEYMAAGRPIVGSNIGSVGEVIDEDVAYVFDGDDPAAMLRAMKRALADDPENRRRKALLAQQRVRDQYDWSHRISFILGHWACRSGFRRARSRR